MLGAMEAAQPAATIVSVTTLPAKTAKPTRAVSHVARLKPRKKAFVTTGLVNSVVFLRLKSPGFFWG